MNKTLVVCVGLIVIGIVLCVAMYMKLNGTLLATGLTIIGSIMSYVFGVEKGKGQIPSIDKTPD